MIPSGNTFVFVGAVAVEFSRGTFRTMLLYEPRRLRLLAGKMAGLLLFAAGVLAVAEVLTWVAARLLAPSYDIASGDWISAAALGDAVTDYGSVLLWGTGYALLGMTIAVLVRPRRPRDWHRVGGPSAPSWTSGCGGAAGGSSDFRLHSGLPVAERADERTCLGAVEHDGQARPSGRRVQFF